MIHSHTTRGRWLKITLDDGSIVRGQFMEKKGAYLVLSTGRVPRRRIVRVQIGRSPKRDRM